MDTEHSRNVGTSMQLPSSLTEIAVKVLTTPDPDLKRDITLEAARLWKQGLITQIGTSVPPMESARPDYVKIVSPKEVPRRGKGGSLISRQAMMHSLVHIENVAIDLSWDIVARFTAFNMPKQFYDDWVEVAEDEARHYNMLNEHLKKMGAKYGTFEAHAGLWDSAIETAADLKARLVLEHIVQEGHGLDVTPKTISRFRSNGDKESADILEVILKEEVMHVTKGLRWFKYLCERDAQDPKDTFHEMVPRYFRGVLKPPFNKEARDQAGMPEDWYLPLSIRTKPIAPGNMKKEDRLKWEEEQQKLKDQTQSQEQ